MPAHSALDQGMLAQIECADSEERAMDRKQLDKLRKILEKRLQELRRSVAEAEHEGRTAQHGPDEGDRASSSHEKEILFRRSTHARTSIKGIEAALTRIDEGTFGLCVNCGMEIGPKRLEAVPWTRYCITCQELIEH